MRKTRGFSHHSNQEIFKMNTKTKFAIFLIFVSFSLFVALFSGYFGLNPSSISIFVSFNPTLASFLYVFLFIVLTTFSFSVSVMTSLGTVFFSITEVFIFSMIGIMGSSVIDFYISRKLGKEYVKNKLMKENARLEKFDEILEKDNFKTIFILSAIFFVPPKIPNLLGGVMKINLRRYFIATLLGNMPNTFFTIYLIKGILYSDIVQIYLSVIGLIAVTSISLYFYKGEIRNILVLSFPGLFKKFNI